MAITRDKQLDDKARFPTKEEVNQTREVKMPEPESESELLEEIAEKSEDYDD